MAALSVLLEEAPVAPQPLFVVRVVDPPKPKERHRTQGFGKGGKRLAHPRTYTPTETVHAAYLVRQAFVERYGDNLEPLDGGVFLRFTAWLQMPGYVPKYRRATILPTVKPDLPNLDMLLADALKGYAWTDDARITDLQTRKRYAGTFDGPSYPCWEVEIFESVAELWW